jgi:ADP-ribosyl-[dinitrogen reductase] hydrolase
MESFKNRLYGGILGACIGDALGVPVEFKSRQLLKQSPVKEMIGYGTYMQPPGTWSDDSSLIFCTMESLSKGYDIKDMAQNFIKYRYESFWTPYGVVFDIGIATNEAIIRLKTYNNTNDSGNNDEMSNGNGSLMRVLPLVYYFYKHKTLDKYNITKEVSSLTHAHVRSVLACYVYIDYALRLMDGLDKWDALKLTINHLNTFLSGFDKISDEPAKFKRILNGSIGQLDENQISSSGYVIDSLEASFWAFLNTTSYSEAVLKAVNLGGDTDTTASITGGLAGLYYGFEHLPKDWIKKLARKKDITDLVERFLISLEMHDK